MWNYSVGLAKLAPLFASESKQNTEELSSLPEPSVNAKSLLKEEIALKNSGKAQPLKEKDDNPAKGSNTAAAKNQHKNVHKVPGPIINLIPKISSDPWQNSQNGSFEVEVQVSQQALELYGSQLVFQYNQDLLRFDGFKAADSKNQAVEKSLTKAVATEKLQNIANLSVGSDKLIFQHNEDNIVLLDVIRMSPDAGFVDAQSNLVLLQFSVINKGVSDINFRYTTYGSRAVLLSDGQGTVKIDSKLLIPETFALYQNYPNPFNPLTTIKYQVPTAAEVSIKIYDLQGRLVSELVNEQQAPAYYLTTWNGKNAAGQLAASGVYIYQFRAQYGKHIYQKTKKMMILK